MSNEREFVRKLPLLPKGWMWIKLEDCVDILDSERVPVNSKEREGRISGKSPSELYPYYGATGQVGWIDDYLFDEELVLLGEDGAPFLDNFKNKAYVITGKNWVNNHAHVLRALFGVMLNTFLSHYLNIIDYKKYITGTTRYKLNQSRMKQIHIPLPPLPEQHRIVAKIEELFSNLDTGVEALKEIKEQLKRYRQAVLKYAFEGKLTSATEEYNMYKMNDVFELIDGDRGKNYPKKKDYLKKGYCLFLSTKNVRPNGFQFSEQVYISKDKHDMLRSGTLKRGDIILTTRGTLGNTALYDETNPFETIRINSGMLILRLKIKHASRKFLVNYLISLLFKNQIKRSKSGTAQPQLPAGVLKDFSIVLPPLIEQKQIVDEIERRFSVVDEIEKVVVQSLKQAERLRQSILKRAFEGKLVPQDPNDEPAEKLLERIKAEKAKFDKEKSSKKKWKRKMKQRRLL